MTQFLQDNNLCIGEQVVFRQREVTIKSKLIYFIPKCDLFLDLVPF